MHIKIYAWWKCFTCSLMILSGLPNMKSNVHECLNWISQTALKNKGHGEALGNEIRNYVFETRQTHKKLLYKIVTEDPTWMCIKAIPNHGPIFFKKKKLSMSQDLALQNPFLHKPSTTVNKYGSLRKVFSNILQTRLWAVGHPYLKDYSDNTMQICSFE